MKAYDRDLRERVRAAKLAGEETPDVADRYDVSPAFVRGLVRRYRQTGSIAPAGGRRGPLPLSATHGDALRRLNAEAPDLTPAEIAARLGRKVAPLTVWRALRALKLTFKKSPTSPPSGTART